MGRVRVVPGVHRRLPDRRDRRRRRARRPPLPELPHPVAHGRPAVPGGARRPRLRLRHLPGRLPMEHGRRAPGRAELEPDAVDDAFPPLDEWLEADPRRARRSLPAAVRARPRRPAAGAKRARRRLRTSADGHRADPAEQPLRGLLHLLADGRRLDHLGLAAVAQDLRDEPVARAVRHVGDGRARLGPAALRAVPRAPSAPARARTRPGRCPPSRRASGRGRPSRAGARSARRREPRLLDVRHLERAPAVAAPVPRLDVPAAIVAAQEVGLDRPRRELVGRAREVGDVDKPAVADALVQDRDGVLLGVGRPAASGVSARA